MPVIVYKTMTIELFYAQGRRIECDNCGQPFCYIHGGVESAQVTGLPLISGDDSMRRDALRQAVVGLKKTAKKAKVGEAICPHCKCYQNWMVSSSRNREMGCFGVLGLLFFGILPGIFAAIYNKQDLTMPLFIGGSLVGLVAGIMFGRSRALNRGPHEDKQDDRSMTDQDFEKFLQKCESQEYDPFLYWWITLGHNPGEKQAPVSIGLEDTTTDPRFPQKLSTDAFIAAQG
ncbi:MAG: hypothetical protein JNM43_08130 [Planctomycetaceae bacterium]|nr:hypothetical protein [Planctomycetaceae bacterium]